MKNSTVNMPSIGYVAVRECMETNCEFYNVFDIREDYETALESVQIDPANPILRIIKVRITAED